MKTTIFFYTNNLISKGILEKTLVSAIGHCIENDAELIITSHYPLIEKYEEVDSSQFNGFNNESFNRYLQKDIRINTMGAKVRNYVFGKQPYVPETILRQLIFSCDKCETENAVLFEHDCLYPDSYIRTVENQLSNYDMTYCKENYVMASLLGFFKCDPHVFLSSFSSKVHIFKKVFEHKLNKIQGEIAGLTPLEPMVQYKMVIVDLPNATGRINKSLKPQTKDTMHLPSMDRQAKGDMVVENSICIDEVLGENNYILEFQHGLNTTNSLSLMRKVVEMEDKKQYIQKIEVHPYWGSSKQYIDLIDYQEKDEISKKISDIGLFRFDNVI